MQNYTIRFVETLKARLEATGCSINAALDVELKALDRTSLLKLRDAALDLARIVELEIMTQDERKEFAFNVRFTRADEAHARTHTVGTNVRATDLAEARRKVMAEYEHLTIEDVALFSVMDQDGHVSYKGN